MCFYYGTPIKIEVSHHQPLLLIFNTDLYYANYQGKILILIDEDKSLTVGSLFHRDP